jgi:hypothetical protein
MNFYRPSDAAMSTGHDNMALASRPDGARTPTVPLATLSNVPGSNALFPVPREPIPLFLARIANA